MTRQRKRASAADTSAADVSAAKRKKHVAAEKESLPSEDEIVNFGDEPQTIPPTRAASMVSTDLDQNQCCMCFRTYEEDVLEETEFNWIKCVCERWVHEDCISEVVMDKNGRELICPYCIFIVRVILSCMCIHKKYVTP